MSDQFSKDLSNLRLLSAVEVAGWQIPSLAINKQQCTAKLPALQRSAAWKPRQVEILWDSLLRGFPVGSFLLTPFQRDRKTQGFLYEDTSSEMHPDPDYHLLDGQQRCNAIALGFLNSWDNGSEHSAALWVDLDKGGINDEREFIFRVLTRSHPWGYQRNDPSKTLEQKNRRKALLAYTEALKLSNNNNRNSECSFGNNNFVRHTWPWDAVCPIPFQFLVEAIMSSSKNIWMTIEKSMMERLSYWNIIEKLDKDIANHENTWKNKLNELFSKPTPAMEYLVESVNGVLGVNRTKPFQIPALILQSIVTEAPATDSQVAVTSQDTTSLNQQDPVETLFIRINSAGTPLQGEELNYSILKSIWPDAQDVVETLSTKIMAPSRLVALVSRLILAKSVRNDTRPPAALDVSRFRRLVHGRDAQCPAFLTSLKDYLNSGNGIKLFELSKLILTGDTSEKVKFKLPAVLTADIARTSPEIFFILIVWIDRLIERDIDPLKLEDKILRRIVGSITALSWFSEEQSSCVQILWKRLQDFNNDNLQDYFSSGALKDCLEITDNGKLPLIPLLPPDLLKEAVENSLYGLGNGLNQKWQTWKWWDNFNGILPKSESARKWYSRRIKEDSDEVEYQREAWTKFTNILWGKKEIVLYAQREWLFKWFSSFDPSSLDQLDDTDRPWDFDHIHPQKYIYGRWYIPQVIKDWHGSIGNFRAWPFELNRSDAESAPRIKFKDAGDEHNRFFLANGKGGNVNKEVLKASFISISEDWEDWPHWESCAPNEEPFEGNYLANAKKYGWCRVSLINATTKRWVALYQEWYRELCIKDLF